MGPKMSCGTRSHRRRSVPPTGRKLTRRKNVPEEPAPTTLHCKRACRTGVWSGFSVLIEGSRPRHCEANPHSTASIVLGESFILTTLRNLGTLSEMAFLAVIAKDHARATCSLPSRGSPHFDHRVEVSSILPREVRQVAYNNSQWELLEIRWAGA